MYFRSVLAKCGDPPLISDAVVSPGTTRLGTTRTYECTEGYKATPKSDDVAVITCQTSGQWSVPNLQCDPGKLIQLYNPLSALHITAVYTL